MQIKLGHGAGVGGRTDHPKARSASARSPLGAKHALALLTGIALTLGASRHAAATTTPTNIPNTLRDSAGNSASRDLLVRADEVLNSITSTVYSTARVWDPGAGVYKVICVHYLNNLLNEALPENYDRLLEDFGQSSLSIWDYYDYFDDIAYYATRGGFKRLKRVTDLLPGDVIVWRYNVSVSSGAWGHGVVVADVPKADSRWSNAYEIRVTDATSTPHSEDNRAGSSGVGAGKMLIRADSTGKPSQIAWTLNGYWKASTDTSIIIVRPMVIW